MKVSGKCIIKSAATFGIVGIILGAFGAHALQETLVANGKLEVWKTAVDYQMIHSVGLLFLGWVLHSSDIDLKNNWLQRSFWCWVIGIFLFSGSLYGLSVGGPKILGPITPIGGVLFILGWACIIPATKKF